jgi:hypothetical protein
MLGLTSRKISLLTTYLEDVRYEYNIIHVLIQVERKKFEIDWEWKGIGK